MPTPMLSNRSIQQIRRLQLDLFATGFSMAHPPVAIVFTRYNPLSTEWDELSPQDVLVRWRHDKKLIRVYGGLTTSMASSPTELDGMFLAFDPFDVSTGDRFTLLGLPGRIINVWPSRNGRRRASFTVEGDKRSA